MRRIFSIFVSLATITLLCSCGSNSYATAGEIYIALKDAGFPVYEGTVLTAETDSNQLLGRPGQYTSKVLFFDISGNATDTNDECTIEVFESKKDAETRLEYVSAISESMPMLSEYAYINDKVLLRIDNCVVPDEAAKYAEWFLAQDFSNFKNEASETTSIINYTEPSPDSETVDIIIPKHICPDEEYAEYEAMAQKLNNNPIYAKVRIENDNVILSMYREKYDMIYSQENYPQVIADNVLKDFSAFREISFSNNYTSANVTVNKNEYKTTNQYGIIKRTFEALVERNANVGNFEPTITINLYEKNADDPFYVFKYKRPYEQFISVTADELVNDFANNETTARKTYMGKHLELRGAYFSMDTLSDETTYILLRPFDDPDSIVLVQCNLRNDYYEGSQSFSKGQEVCVVGQCVGYGLTLTLDDCIVF